MWPTLAPPPVGPAHLGGHYQHPEPGCAESAAKDWSSGTYVMDYGSVDPAPTAFGSISSYDFKVG